MPTNQPNPTKRSTYSCLFPVYGVRIGNDLRRGLRIGNVRLVQARAVERSPRSFGIRSLKTKLKRAFEDDYFEKVETLAHLRWTRAFRDRSTEEEERQVREALLVVAGFCLGAVDRDRFRLTLHPIRQTSVKQVLMFDTSSDAFRVHGRWGMPVEPLTLDGQWKSAVDRYGFSAFLRILRGSTPITAGWKRTLARAVQLAGQSALATRRQEAFLLNMIALETLLTEQGDRFPDALLERLMALLGWTVGERSDAWKADVERVYRLRCSFVHAGDQDDITGTDLYLADTLLVNVLLNLTKYNRRFESKDAIFKYARELDARRTLGLPLRDMRMKLRYIRRPLTSHLLTQLEDDSRWRWL